MSLKTLFYSTIISVGLLNLLSCQKVIDIDLNSTDPKIVIQGLITDQDVADTIKITRTVDFKETNTFPPVSGATVLINDDAENSEILTEVAPGIYVTSKIKGVPGRTYTISVKVNEQEYKAISKMPLPVDIAELKVRPSDFGRDKVVDVSLIDPANLENYYRFIQIINGSQQKEIDIFDDELNDGREINYTLFTDDENVDLHKDDTVVVLLRSIDKPTFEYYRTAREAIGGSQSPANPNTNISNGALGYFSAYSQRSDTVVVQ